MHQKQERNSFNNLNSYTMEEKTVTLTSDDVTNITFLIFDEINLLDSRIKVLGEKSAPLLVEKREVLRALFKKLTK